MSFSCRFERLSNSHPPVHGMCDVDRQKEASRNVAYSADGTWTDAPCPFQRANLNLHLAARRIQARNSRWERLTPRTVRDSIPRSKLAQYSNYEYDEARELSYTTTVVKFERLQQKLDGEERKEPWMLEEIDDLLMGFSNYSRGNVDEEEPCTLNHESLPCPSALCENSFESPFLDARNFDEMVLKLKIVSGSIKKLWNIHYFHCRPWHQTKNASDLLVYRSPALQLFTETEDLDKTSEERIEFLTKRLKEQNTWIFKTQSRSWLERKREPADGNRRLYSAVLQGPPTAQSLFQFPSVKGVQATQENGHASTPYDPYVRGNNSQAPLSMCVQATPSSYHRFPPYANAARVYASNLVPSPNVLNLPLVLPNAYYQGGLLPGYRNMMFPPRPQVVVPSSGWFLQPALKLPHPTASYLTRRLPLFTPNYGFNSAPRPRPKDEAAIYRHLDEVVAKTVNAVIDDDDESGSYIPVTGVPSDELEMQALEQYSASNTNVFQELERQAREQYETSENWNGPPNCLRTASFGGWLRLRGTKKAIELSCTVKAPGFVKGSVENFCAEKKLNCSLSNFKIKVDVLL